MSDVFVGHLMSYAGNIKILGCVFLGAMCSYALIHMKGQVQYRLFWGGITYMIVSTLAGYFLLMPVDIRQAFIAGLTGWYVASKILAEQNSGLSKVNKFEGAADEEKLRQWMQK